MTYPEALAYVLSLQAKGWRMGLDRIQELVRRTDELRSTMAGSNLRSTEVKPKIQYPKPHTVQQTQSDPAFFHVAGTNGKGSVTRYVHSILHEAGHRVGGYYSPYVYEPRERIQFGGDPILEEDYAKTVSDLMLVAETMATPEFGGGVSKFEFETAMGLLYWQRKGCEFVALEVGMGGRLDATNIVHPAASAIVSIGLDHTAYLGDTLAQIAREKAGIIKPGVPVIVGAVPDEAWEAIEPIAKKHGAPLWSVGREIALASSANVWTVTTPNRCIEGLLPGIPGVKQPENVAIALAMLDAAGVDVPEAALREGVSRARLPGRFELRSVGGDRVILDGAHNAEAAQVLADTFIEHCPGETAVLLTGMLEGHDPVAFYQRLSGCFSEAHVSPIDFHRALPPKEVKQALEKLEIPSESYQSVEEAVSAALDSARRQQAVLLVAGSFYLLGEVGPLLDRLAV